MDRGVVVSLFAMVIFILGVGQLAAYGNCLDFDGSNDYVNCGTSSRLRPSNYLTVECWIYVNSYSDWEGVLSNSQDNGDNESGFTFFFYNGYLTWWMQTVGGVTGNYTSYPRYVIPTNTWTHIAGTYNYSTGMMYLYVNGVMVDSYDRGTNAPVDWTNMPNFFCIGAYKDDDENYYFDGRIDDVRVWADDLTQSQIQDRMYGELTGSEAYLLGYWKLNETSGTNADEATSYDLDGTLVNSPVWTTSYAPVGQFPSATYYNNPESLWNNTGTAWTNECYGLTLQDYSTASITTTEFYSFARSTASGTATTYLPADVDARALREWYLDDNANDAINMKFDLGDFAGDLYVGGLAASNYKLLRRTSTSSAFAVVASGASLSGSTVYFNDYMPLGDAYYTVGRDNNFAVVSSTSQSSISETTVGLSSEVTSDGGGTVTDRGFVYVAGTGTPTTANSVYHSGSGTGVFTGEISGLDPNTTYTVRAFAINSEGTAYGSSLTILTLPDQPSHIFPQDGAIDMPRQVTINWRWEGAGAPTGFRVYRNGAQVGSDIAWNGDIVYNQALPLASWGETVNWRVNAYNTSGETSDFLNWDFVVRAEPGNPDEAPGVIVYNEMTGVTTTGPFAITAPEINLGGSLVQPVFTINFAAAPNLPVLGCWVTDQPEHPVPNPANCAAAFKVTYPSGISTNLSFNCGLVATPTQLYHWNNDSWEDLSNSAVFGPGTVSFDFISSSRAEEEFVINNGEGTLPVELSSFSATYSSAGFVSVEWTTQSECDMMGYYILRGENGLLGDAIRVSDLVGAANSSEQTDYRYDDIDVNSGATYYYWLQSNELDGTSMVYGPRSVTIQEGEDPGEVPDVSYVTAIDNIYPNPFNPSTTFCYTLIEPMHVTVTIYDLKGRLVRTLHNGAGEKGVNSVTWDGYDSYGKQAASGVYLFALKTPEATFTSKAIMLK